MHQTNSAIPWVTLYIAVTGVLVVSFRDLKMAVSFRTVTAATYYGTPLDEFTKRATNKRELFVKK